MRKFVVRNAKWVITAVIIWAMAAAAPFALAVGGFGSPDDVTTEPSQIGPATVVTTGNRFGLIYSVGEYQSNIGLCIYIEFTGTNHGVNEGCGWDVTGDIPEPPPTRQERAPDVDITALPSPSSFPILPVVSRPGAVGVDVATFPGEEHATFIFGPVVPTASLVRIKLAGGRVIERTPIQVSDRPLNAFFFATHRIVQVRQVVALDAAGVALGSTRGFPALSRRATAP